MTPSQEDRKATEALHALLESLGNATGVLLNLRTYLEALETRYSHLGRRVVRSMLIGGAGFALALVVNACQIRDVEKAQGRALTAAETAEGKARELDVLVERNKALIMRLRKVAHRAQVNGARADVQQCRQIERLKSQIRAVLRQSPKIDSPAGRKALGRFERTDCKRLPNAVPVPP